MELFNSINVIYFLLYVTCIWLQYVPSSHAWKNLQRPQLGTHILSLNVLKHRNIHRLHSSEGDDDYGKPSVIPFDGPGTFAREDVLAPDLKKAIEKLKKAKNDLNNESNADTSNEKKPSEPSIQSQRRPSRTDDLSYIDDRPTGRLVRLKCSFIHNNEYGTILGYDNITDEEDDDVPSYMPSDDPYIIRALKDIYIGSPYDRLVVLTLYEWYYIAYVATVIRESRLVSSFAISLASPWPSESSSRSFGMHSLDNSYLSEVALRTLP